MFTLSFRGNQLAVEPSNTFEGLLMKASRTFGLERETIKFIHKGKLLDDSSFVNLLMDARTGTGTGIHIFVTGSTTEEIERVRGAHDLPGLASFEAEELRELRRRAAASLGPNSTPSGRLSSPSPYTFRAFRALTEAEIPGARPPPSEALALLKRLASDPGIVALMTNHRWTVGQLAELPPDGKVGVSPVCVLGLNRNKGQEILLRLRTDDLKGWRQYNRIRETLVHELAHNVHSEHDSAFKIFNSQLLKECAAADWRRHAAGALDGVGASFEGPELTAAERERLEILADPARALMHATSATSGRALGVRSDQAFSSDPRTAAAEAALRRLGTLEPGPSSAGAGAEEMEDEEGGSVPSPLSAPAAPAPSVPPPVFAPSSEFMDADLMALLAADAGLEAVMGPVAAKMDIMRSAVRSLLGEGEAGRAALATISTVLANLAAHPGEPKYRRLRVHKLNSAFSSLGEASVIALDILRAAGFGLASEQEADVLVLNRDDPGLVYLVFSLVSEYGT